MAKPWRKNRTLFGCVCTQNPLKILPFVEKGVILHFLSRVFLRDVRINTFYINKSIKI